MSTDFGFKAANTPGYFFVSYNTEDSARVAEICRYLHSSGLPIWYDNGIEHDSLWEGVLAERIDGCAEAIFFITKGIFEKGRSCGLDSVWTYKEYDLARIYEKRVLVVHLDEIVPKEDVPHSMMTWWQQINPGTRQGVVAFDKSPKKIADMLLLALGYDFGKTYTMADSIDHPVFNSVTDHPKYGDERDFIHIKKGSETEWRRSIALEPGAQYIVKVFFRNDANPQFNSGKHNHKGVAVITRMSIDVPQYIAASDGSELSARIMWGSPKQECFDSIKLVSSTGKSLYLRWVIGQATIQSNWKANGRILPSNLFSHTGALLGLNDLNGVVPAGDEFSGLVRFYVNVESASD